MRRPIIFAASDYYSSFLGDVCRAYPGSVKGESHAHRFPNGELRVSISQDVSGRDCIIIGSTAPPDEQLLHLIMLADTLRRAGASKVYAILPYLGYARQDKIEAGSSGGIALIGALLRSSGIESIRTIDVHSPKDQKYIGLPLESIDSSVLFASHVRSLGWTDAVFVAPDAGARHRTSSLALASGSHHPITYLHKTHTDGVQHHELVGEVSSRVIVVDDILDTGETLVSACRLLRTRGADEIAIVATHGLFTGEQWKQLLSPKLNVRTLIVSDSHPRALAVKSAIKKVVTITPAMAP